MQGYASGEGWELLVHLWDFQLGGGWELLVHCRVLPWTGFLAAYTPLGSAAGGLERCLSAVGLGLGLGWLLRVVVTVRVNVRVSVRFRVSVRVRSAD